jgi:hypothetical protein
MKKIFTAKNILIFLSPFLSSCNTSTEKANNAETIVQNDYNWMQLKGKARQIIKTVYYSAYQKFDDWYPEDSLNSKIFIYNFNRDGFITTSYMIIPKSKDTIVEQVSYKNNKSTGLYMFKTDKLIDSAIINWINDSTNIETSYDSEQHLKRETRSRYNSNARLIESEEVATNDSGKITMRIVNKYLYDSNNSQRQFLISMDKIKDKTDTSVYHILAADKTGNTIKKIVLDKEKKVLALVIYSYSYY